MLVTSVGYFNNDKLPLLNKDNGLRHSVRVESLGLQESNTSGSQESILKEIYNAVKRIFSNSKTDCEQSLDMIA